MKFEFIKWIFFIAQRAYETLMTPSIVRIENYDSIDTYRSNLRTVFRKTIIFYYLIF